MTYIGFPTLSLIYMVIFLALYYSKRRIGLFENRIVIALMIINSIGLILELGCYMVMAFLKIEDTFLGILILKSYVAYIPIFNWILTGYIFVITNKNYGKTGYNMENYFYKVLLSFLPITFILVLITYIVPLHYSNVYPKYYTYGIATDFILYSMIILLPAWISRCIISIFGNKNKQINSKIYLLLLGIILIGSSGALTQIIDKSILIITSAETVMLALIYFTIENPDMKMLDEVYHAKEISDKINSFQICESTSKYSIEQSYPKSNINKYYKTIKDFNNQYFPFEFINYSFSDTNNDKNKKNLTSKINKVKINKNKKRENKYPDLMDNYRTYIPQNNIKLSHKEDDIYTREMALMKKKELKLEEMRKKEMEEENSELTYKPKINKKSEILSKNKMPIYKRLKQIEIEKNIKMEKIKENISKDEKNKNINLNNDNINNNQKNKFNEEDFKNWLISNENWNAKKINKLNNIKNEVKKEQEFTEEGAFQFKPRINKNSEKLFKSNYILASIPACERLCYGTETKEDFSKRIQNEEKLDFIPEINKNYPISDKYYDFMKQDQFQIYYENMQRNKNKK